jgi:two-component system, NarL family, response regulator NreC
MKLSVLMIDDHPPIIQGYKSILSFNTSGYEIETVAVHNCKAAYELISSENKPNFDVIFTDITLPPYPEKNIESGEDLIPLLQQFCPDSKILVLTSHEESVLLYKIYREFNPKGIMIKSDFMPEELITAFENIVEGKYHYSETLLKLQKMWSKEERILDS